MILKNQQIGINQNMLMNQNMIQLTGNKDNNMPSNEEKFSKELKLDDEIYILKIKKIKPSQIVIRCENKFNYLSLYGYSITLTYDEFCKLGKSFRLYDNIDEIYDTIKNLFKGVDFTFKNEPNNNSLNLMNNNPNFGNNMGMGNMGMGNMSNMGNMASKNNMGNMGNQASMSNMGNMASMSNMAMNSMSLNNQFNNNNNFGNINQYKTNKSMDKDGLHSKDSPNVKLENSNNNSINLILKIPLLNEKYEKIKIEFKKENKDIKKQYEKLKNKFLKIKKIVFPEMEEKHMQNNQMGYNANTGNMQSVDVTNVIPSVGVMGSQLMSTPLMATSSSETILSQIRNEFENNL